MLAVKRFNDTKPLAHTNGALFFQHSAKRPLTLSIADESEQSKEESLAKKIRLMVEVAPSVPESRPTNPFYVRNFSDEAIAIAYKEGHIDGKPSGLLAKIIAKRVEKYTTYNKLNNRVVIENNGVVEQPYQGLLLVQNDTSKTWLIYDTVSKSYFRPTPNERYIFVTMPDQSIRIAPFVKSGHVMLANYSPYVRYAGEVTFNEGGEIQNWNNQSGGYCPSPFLAHQAGFGSCKAFQALCDRNDPTKQRWQAFTQECVAPRLNYHALSEENYNQFDNGRRASI